MGGAEGGQRAPGGLNRPYGDQMMIDRFDLFGHWKASARKTAWSRLCSEILGIDEYEYLTAILNLDWRHSTDQNEVSKGDLVRGFERYIWPLLPRLHPRILCPLSNPVWDTINPTLTDYRVQFSKCPINLTDSRGNRPTQEPFVAKLPGCEALTLILKPHRHPSRALSREQMQILGKVAAWFFRATL
jgi:hypothetical protein